jgi:hypothetical protein
LSVFPLFPLDFRDCLAFLSRYTVILTFGMGVRYLFFGQRLSGPEQGEANDNP